MFKLFECAIQLGDWRSPVDLHQMLKRICERLVQKDRLNFVVRNCSERMLKILKKVCDSHKVTLTTDHFPQYYLDSLKQLSVTKNSRDESDLADDLSSTPLDNP